MNFQLIIMTTTSILFTIFFTWVFDSAFFKGFYFCGISDNNDNIYYRDIKSQDDVALKILAWINPIGGLLLSLYHFVNWFRQLPPK